ncbi:RNA methyltransferase [Lederbergia sp. NSJ-179]|uniref:TrmH family RNA methyltransferase n=1 Tax=Lederbergia sp. NSJ-179 TaxID=2931402 RepID=UPI001FD55897|nr:RNA methyltransferase [Lederbergia sp. NSJ-179]MCJ7839809.1 RNA methyltransferase [Lederbergia sp. NSJ-179]
MEYIQSTKNERVKLWKKLLLKKYRDQTDTYLIEGEHLIIEALKTNEVVEVMIQEDKMAPKDWSLNDEEISVFTISKEISQHISDTKSPQGIFAVCKKRKAGVDFTKHSRFLLLDGVQDPGNIGTIIRTADAAGVEVVILANGSGDVYNPKVIRSAQGSHFHLFLESGDLLHWLEKIKQHDIPLYGTALEGGDDFRKVAPTDSFALVVGNEGAGVSREVLEKTDQNLYIPIYGQSESLNVSIAAGILLYHLRKQI